MPNQFMWVSTHVPLSSALNQINQNFAKLDREAVTKKFGKGPNQVVVGKAGKYVGMVVGELDGDAIIYGRYLPDRLGTLKIEGGVPVALDGQHPVDGHQGNWIVPTGRNVIEELGGTW
jgi:hypothetical protein